MCKTPFDSLLISWYSNNSEQSLTRLELASKPVVLCNVRVVGGDWTTLYETDSRILISSLKKQLHDTKLANEEASGAEVF